jgi:hypothetical protein
VTADTGFANEANMQYLYEDKINGYIPDNQFRYSDLKFAYQKSKYGKRHQNQGKNKQTEVIPASEFNFDPISLSCRCPAGELLSYLGTGIDKKTNSGIYGS